ncbi:MAG: FtsW/RodA/SpoVE family cell cycle protein [Lachnospiraceae bacterium]|nr:FtsW/RodA/SpoVE family cell cycle protein [Lachnospiraceae bacterium]
MKVYQSEKIKKKKAFMESVNQGMPVLLGLFLVQAAFLLYSCWRGKGEVFIRISLILIPLTLVTFGVVHLMKGDAYLVIWNALLLNMGFLIQAVCQDLNEEGLSESIQKDILKLCIAFALAYMAAIVFRFVSDWLSLEIMIPVFLLFQTGLMAALQFLGREVGNADQKEQIAKIVMNLGGIDVQPMEFIKIIYVFVLGIILCKNEYKDKRFLKLPREFWAAAYILFTAVPCILLFNEGGSALILLLTGIVMVLLFGDKREIVKLYVSIGSILAGAACVLTLLLHDKYTLFERVPVLNKLILFLDKVYQRFYVLFSPEAGGQNIQSQKAIAMGSLFGPSTNRYLVYVPRQEEDMIFSKLVGTTGIVIGIIAIGAIFLMFREGLVIARKNCDSYYKGLSIGFSLVLALEGAVHIACNLSLFPITGIPLYFVSHGFSSMTGGMIMVAFLIVLSRGTQERSLYVEETYYERIRNLRK